MDFRHKVLQSKYAKEHEKHASFEDTWKAVCYRVVNNVMMGASSGEKQAVYKAMLQFKVIPGGRTLYAAGMPYQQLKNCALFSVEDSSKGWASLYNRITMALTGGMGLGVDYSHVRCEGSPIKGLGGIASGPLSVMQAVNDIARHIRQGGSRRAALWAGLDWKHKDIYTFIRSKNWNEWHKEGKRLSYDNPAPLDMTNISVILDKAFFDAIYDPDHKDHAHAKEVYISTVQQMMVNGCPGFSINYHTASDSLRNACTEVTSSDDSDTCTLINVNMAQCTDIYDYEQTVQLAALFGLYVNKNCHYATEAMEWVGKENNRILVGKMGVHEWFMQRGLSFGSVEGEYTQWQKVYLSTANYAKELACYLGMNEPKGTLGTPPTGTVSIVAGTSSGIQPIFASAYQRHWFDKDHRKTDSVIDPVSAQYGVGEDSYTLGSTREGIKRQLDFLKYEHSGIDQGISYTLLLPADFNDAQWFADMLLSYLPHYRGFTVYKDGGHIGQPIDKIDFSEAMGYTNEKQGTDVCTITGKGECGE